MASPNVVRLHEQAKALSQALRDYPKALKGEVLRDACVAAAVPVKIATQAFVPRRSGALRQSIQIKGIAFKDGNGMALVGVDRKALFSGGKKIPKGVPRLGKVDKPSKYAHLVEFGHIARDGSFVAPRSFLRTGLNAAAPLVENIMLVKVNTALKKVRIREIKAGRHSA